VKIFKVKTNLVSQMLSEVGRVKSAKVVIDRMAGQSKGFGFAEMTNQREAEKQLKCLSRDKLTKSH
jgi:RNA recognition motif-containing protein